jgi:[lysine-biosynthesis-protein LysW]---L-2-aminoadipate ligase
MRVAIVAHRQNETNLKLVEAAPPGVDFEIVPPTRVLGLLGPGDAALARLDVLPSLEGIEPGIWEVGRLESDGVHVLNRLRALFATHDKLQTARILHAVSVPHPRTAHMIAAHAISPIEPPVVVKPRFGSWGKNVTLCESRAELTAYLEELSTREWFRRQGVLVQELIPPLGHDLRLVVAGGQVVGAVRRHAAEGEWRTNVALGAEREATAPPQAAREIAVAAAAAVEGDLVGVDLMPTHEGGWVVIELNGAVEFNQEYSLDRDVFSAVVDALLSAIDGASERSAAALA